MHAPLLTVEQILLILSLSVASALGVILIAMVLSLVWFKRQLNRTLARIQIDLDCDLPDYDDAPNLLDYNNFDEIWDENIKLPVPLELGEADYYPDTNQLVRTFDVPLKPVEHLGPTGFVPGGVSFSEPQRQPKPLKQKGVQWPRHQFRSAFRRRDSGNT